MPKKNMRQLFSYLTLMLMFCVLAGCDDSESKPSGSKSGKSFEAGPNRGMAKRSTPVEISPPSIGTAVSVYRTTTTLTPSSDANINARAGGVIREILREEGDDVKKGDVLLRMENDDQKLRLKRATQELDSAEREYSRLSLKKDGGVVSLNEWESAEKAYKTSKTEKEIAKLELSYTEIIAPFDGRVVWREVDLGTHVNESDLLYRMMAINPLLARVHIPSNRIGTLSRGAQVDISVETLEEPIQGIVELISPIVDPLTGTIKVTIRLDDYPEFVRPGDFVSVSLLTQQRQNAMLLPSNAVLEERGKPYVYIAEAGMAKRKDVKTGFIMGDKIEILSGLESTDDVVTKGQGNLNDDAPIRVLTQNEINQQNLSQR